ncbi:lysoplasmalogenase [Phytoactinopolyspora endophytica]|uniref:lysoplasmalogenase n=1 Tax=Phytoactinopolyspora endophytica TaxID=1642495 RepID=UPI00101C99A7|nr:lysoplasmalogenase [Phytoactinopolyspora endophytica]
MSTTVTLLAALTLIATLVDWLVTATRQRTGRRWAGQQWTRPAPVALLAVAAVAAGSFDEAAGVWLVVALVCGAVGDALLVDATEQRFVGGLVAFLLGHLAYLACFLALEPEWDWRPVAGAVVVAVSFTIARRVTPGARRAGGPGLAVAVAIYIGVIGAKTVIGWATGSYLVAAGTTFFVASDTMLAINRFVRPLEWSKLPVIAMYHVGQVMIATGVLVLL